jgi:cell fate regulator YaaT (PSP1 superfamily)
MSAALVRYGAIPEVGRFPVPPEARWHRGTSVVVRTSRGIELGTLLTDVAPHANGFDDELSEQRVLREATGDDLRQAEDQRGRCDGEFAEWQRRIAEWRLDLQLIDLERTLDGAKLIAYVLNERGPDCTKLALQAAARGLGAIEVQPVGAEGLVQADTGGGCGSGSCGSGGCGH